MNSRNEQESNIFDLLHQLFLLEKSINIIYQEPDDENIRLKEYQIIREKIIDRILSNQQRKQKTGN